MNLNPEHVGAQFLLRSWPFPRGSGRLADKFFSMIRFSEDMPFVRTTDGFVIRVIANDLIGRHIYLTGEFDRSTFEVLHDFSEPGDTLLDVGANIGYMSACFLHLVPESQVVALDPQPGVREMLTDNLSQFGARQQVFHVALSDTSGECSMEINTRNRGASKIIEYGQGEKVLMWSVSKMLDTVGDNINIIKIDVEGHEEQVVKALRPYLAGRIKPRAILFEDHGAKSARDAALGSEFDAAGYMVFGVQKRLTRLNLIQIRSASDCRMNDYVAVRKNCRIPERAQHAYALQDRLT